MWRRLADLGRRRRLDHDLEAELAHHLDALVEQYESSGLSREEARRAARRDMGGLTRARESYRDQHGLPALEALWQDARYALRTLRKSPGFAAVAIVTLALGIGANASIFAVAYPLFLRPLPYLEAEEIVALSSYIPQSRARFPSLPVRAIDFDEFRRSNRVFSAISAITPVDFNLTGVPEPERLYGARVSANLFTLLGVSPTAGRLFLAEENVEGRDRVVIISHELWTRRFGADRSILNRPLSLNGQTYQVVGVMPPGFLFPTGAQLHPLVPLGPRVDVWKPMGFTRSELTSEGSWNWGVLARLKPNTSLAAAQEDLDRITATIVTRVLGQIPDSGFDLRAQLQPIREMFSGRMRQAMLVLVGAVALLLLIACVNLANLLLSRFSSRDRELATRRALGASRLRVGRQLLTESVTVATLGGVAGVLVAGWGAPILVALGPADLAGLDVGRLSPAVLVFALAASLAAGVLFGLASAIPMSRQDPGQAIRGGAFGASAIGGGRLRTTLVSVEVALCTTLLVASGLLLHSLLNVMALDKGFAVEQILSANVVLPGRDYQPPGTVAFYRDLVERVRGLPGVTSAGAVSALPLTRESDTTQVHLDSDTQYRLTERPVAAYRNVTSGYFATMEVELLAGRYLADQEPVPAAVVSEGLARRLWPGVPVSAVPGRRVRPGDIRSAPVTVVGVVRDVRTVALDREPFPVIYRPHAQAPSREMSVVVRTVQAPETLAAEVRATVWKLDGNLPAPLIRTMGEVVSASMAPRRFQATLVMLFGMLALALAAVGIYGVTNYAVARQTQEIGLRMALGAKQRDVLRTILIRAIKPVAAGLAVGLLAARIAAVSFQSTLFGVEPIDPLAFGGGCVVLLLAALLASYVPARRAAKVDPLTALRCE
jgi:putative ABC transport system permease protein